MKKLHSSAKRGMVNVIFHFQPERKEYALMLRPASSHRPAFWIPTLYFAEGVPAAVVTEISILIFHGLMMPDSSGVVVWGCLPVRSAFTWLRLRTWFQR